MVAFEWNRKENKRKVDECTEAQIKGFSRHIVFKKKTTKMQHLSQPEAVKTSSDFLFSDDP